MPAVQNDDSDEEIFEEEGGFRIGGVYVPPPPVAICASETYGTRLIISQIVNLNFKSYAGKQVLGPFHKCFTGIIGPNGSGKSNVIDSLLFVFGYRATKIRSKKVSVLIHKSEKHRDIRSATVEVHFHQINERPDGTDEKVDGSEVVISRTANADNSSFYTINGKRSQFKDVALILRSHGIDLVHNRFLILQGEVEQIALMKPKAQSEHETGMLEYLEDIIGTARYKGPIQKLEAKVNELNDERLEKLNRLRIAERERESLREPMEEAIKFLAVENEKTELTNMELQIRIHESTKLIATLEETKKQLDDAMAEVLKKIEDHKSEQVEMEKDVAEKVKELDGLKKLKEQISDTLAKNDSEMTKLKESITYTNKNRKKNIEGKAAEEKKLRDLEKVPEKNQKEIDELKVVSAKLEDSRKTAEADVDKVLASVREETQELQDRKEVLLNELMGLTATRDKAKSAYEIANTELSLYQNSEKTEKAKLERLETVQETNKRRMQDLKGVKSHLEQKLPASEKELSDATAELEKLRGEDATLTREFNSKRATLEEKRSSVNAFKSRNKVLNFIMQKKAEGELPGVFGRLGDLGGIDPRYDCAISTACGALDHIVTDTVDTATKCVELLKRFDVGRGNFVALDKQQHLISAYQQSFRAPEKVPRLFDLIQIQDERVKPAFYFALRDTLVANDLMQGRRVAYGATRYRVVTVDGEVLEVAGTMSGGGREKKRGRMGRSATVVNDDTDQVEVAGMENRVAELQQRLTQVHDRMRDRENTISNLTRDTRKWKLELSNATAEIKELVLEEPKIRDRIKAQEEAVVAAAPDPDALGELTSKVENLKQEFDEAAAKADTVQKEVDKFTAQIKAMAGGRMKEAQKKLDEINKKLDKISSEIVKLTVDIKTSVRNSKRSSAKIENLTSDIAEAEGKLRGYDEALKSLAQDSREKDKQLEETTSKIEDLQGTVKGVKKKIAEVLKIINKIRSDKIDDDKKLEEVNRKLGDAKQVPRKLKDNLSKLKLHQVPFRPPAPELKTFSEEELDDMDSEPLVNRVLVIDEQLKCLKPNLSTIDEFQAKDATFNQRNQELEDVNVRRDEVRQGYEDLRKARLNEFMEGFSIISLKLKEMYQTITMGGDAEFDLLDSLDPFAEGVSFSVRPPKKSWKSIANLSGGEKTLSSLALVFALHYYKPSPLYVMDEIDAALDFKNVSIVGHYVKERTKNAQFIIISLRSNMFELANLLVGIYKTNNCTKSLTILSPEGGFRELVPFIAGGLVNGDAARPNENEDEDMDES